MMIVLFSIDIFVKLILDLFKRVDDFLSLHPKEVVLIDINHFYEFREQHHDKLLDMINNLFGDRLIHRPATVRTAMSYTLNKIWNSTGRVCFILFIFKKAFLFHKLTKLVLTFLFYITLGLLRYFFRATAML